MRTIKWFPFALSTTWICQVCAVAIEALDDGDGVRVFGAIRVLKLHADDIAGFHLVDQPGPPALSWMRQKPLASFALTGPVAPGPPVSPVLTTSSVAPAEARWRSRCCGNRQVGRAAEVVRDIHGRGDDIVRGRHIAAGACPPARAEAR